MEMAPAAHQDVCAQDRPAPWAFDEGVTAQFDDMLRRSIPNYETMRRAVTMLAARYRKPHTDIVDLGTSRGEAVSDLIFKFGALNRFVLVEHSPPMLAAVRKRYQGYINAGVVDVRDLDLRTQYPPVGASVTLSILTLQFTPIEHRPHILQRIYDHLLPGGAFLLVEKLIGTTAEMDTTLVDTYYAEKRAQGYADHEIDEKRRRLEGTLVPVTAAWNEELLQRAGFSQVECFWRWMNFAGWLAVK